MAKIVLGIDIAYEAVKICGLAKIGRNYRLVGLNYAPIPKDSWTADELKNRDEIARVLRDSLKSAKPSAIHTKDAMIALPETAVYSATFSMPILKKDELEQALPFEVAERLSINPEEYHIDYETLTTACQPMSETVRSKGGQPSAEDQAMPPKAVAPTPENPKTVSSKTELTSDEPHMAIFAVAAKRSLVESVMELCQLAGLNVSGIDVKAGAIVNALIATNDRKMRLIVDLGAGTTGVTVAEGKAIHLISSVPIGTKGLGDDLAGEFEKFKAMASPIFDELVHATKFFENRMCPGRKIEEIVLTGGATTMKGITEFFTAQTGLKTVVGNPFSQVDVRHYPIPEELVHKFADSVGLAMRG